MKGQLAWLLVAFLSLLPRAAFSYPMPPEFYKLSDELVCRIVGTMILKARHILADLDYSRINMPNNH